MCTQCGCNALTQKLYYNLTNNHYSVAFIFHWQDTTQVTEHLCLIYDCFAFPPSSCISEPGRWKHENVVPTFTRLHIRYGDDMLQFHLRDKLNLKENYCRCFTQSVCVLQLMLENYCRCFTQSVCVLQLMFITQV